MFLAAVGDVVKRLIYFAQMLYTPIAGRGTQCFMSRGEGLLLCYIGPEHVLKRLTHGQLSSHTIRQQISFQIHILVFLLGSFSRAFCPSVGTAGSIPATR